MLTLVVVAVTGVTIVVVMASRERDRILAVLVGISGGLISIQVANVHVFSLVVVLWWCTSPRVADRIPLRSWLPLVAVAPICVTAFTGDMVNNPKLAAQFLLLAVSAGMVASRASWPMFLCMLRGLLVTCSAASLMSIGQTLHVFPNVGLHTDVISAGRPYAFYPEPDWAGLFSTLGLILSFRILPPKSTLFYVAIITNAAGSALAAARAAWVALAVSTAIYLVASFWRRPSPNRRKGAIGGIAVLIVFSTVALASAPVIRHELSVRVQSVIQRGGNEDVSGRAREQQTEGLLKLSSTSPWYGHGVSASGRVGVSGIYDARSENNLGSNWILSLWVDAKFLSLPCMLLLLLGGFLHGRTIQGQILLFLCVNNLFSNAMIQPVTWLFLGATLAGLRASPERILPSLNDFRISRECCAASGVERISQPREGEDLTSMEGRGEW